MTADRLVLVDGYAQVYRAFYAIPGLTTPDGRPSNAIYGVVRFLLKLDEELPGRWGVVVFDRGRPARRLELLPEYKAQRPPMPDELRAQQAPLREWLAALGWPVLEEEGREADDVIAALALNAGADRETAIVSHDKDLTQLVAGSRVYMLRPDPKGKLERMGPAEVEAKFGVKPEQIRDYLALLGDSSDNIPGVPGVGSKTAAQLLQQFGSVEQILAHVADVAKPSVRSSLAANTDLLQRNVQLVSLETDLPAGWQGVESLRRRPPDFAKLRGLAADFGFKSLLPLLDQARQTGEQPLLF